MKLNKDQNNNVIITLIEGDGIGPEIVQATRKVIEASGAKVSWDKQVAGKKIFEQGIQSGVPSETFESIKTNGIALKGPLETPIGFGQKSANVTLRKLFETYGNIRPVRELPSVHTAFTGKNTDIVIVRENVEDLYAGIEHMQTPGVAQCLKLITRKGCEKIVRLAFEFAVAEGRKKITCTTKANIMKFTEGLLKKTFEDIAPEYPEIEAEHMIVDNCAHQLVRYPESFDVIVSTNMNGDILSDLTSGLTGGLGFAPSANIGNHAAMFEAVHGSAPDIAGKNMANPMALILAGVMMLRHIGEMKAANSIQQSLLYTLEQGVYTGDVRPEGCVASDVFTQAVIANLGQTPTNWTNREVKQIKMPQIAPDIDFVKTDDRKCVGADIFVDSGKSSQEVGQTLDQICADTKLKLKMISNRGTKVYPDMGAFTDCVDHWRCRFVVRADGTQATHQDILGLTQKISDTYEWMHIEKLWEFDGKRAYSMAQGED